MFCLHQLLPHYRLNLKYLIAYLHQRYLLNLYYLKNLMFCLHPHYPLSQKNLKYLLILSPQLHLHYLKNLLYLIGLNPQMLHLNH